MRPEAGYSMVERWSSTRGRTTRTTRRALPGRRRARLKSVHRPQGRRDRTSIRGPQPTLDLGAVERALEYSAIGLLNGARERKPRARPTDGADKKSSPHRPMGVLKPCCTTKRRPHQALALSRADGGLGAWRSPGKAVDMVDNASALPTCPQPQQKTQPLAA